MNVHKSSYILKHLQTNHSASSKTDTPRVRIMQGLDP